MYQRSLLDDAPTTRSVSVVGIGGSVSALKPAQKRFNQLIARLTQQRQELGRWRTFHRTYHEQLVERYEPALARLRAKQIAMVLFLDRTMDGKALSRLERSKVREMLGHLLSDLLSQQSQDPDLVRLYDKYADRSFGGARQDQREVIANLVSEAFGVDVPPFEGGGSPEEMAEWLAHHVHAERPQTRRRRKPTAKTPASETARQATEGATRAVREVFRKLVSELHPDREADPSEHARKTELMQRVNQAYAAGDLLALLELQLSIEQIDPAALAGLADERLRHYNHVLEEQSRRLRDELAEFLVPFAMATGKSPGRQLSPEIVQRTLDGDIQDIKDLVLTLEEDLDRFRDIHAFKRSLRDYDVDPIDDLGFSMPEVSQGRRRNRARRR
jgi:hypothetical protein